MKMKFINIAMSISIWLCISQFTESQILSPGICPVHPVHQNFDIPRYLGLWYEYRRYEQQFQLDGECVTAQYSLNEDGSVRVFNSMVLAPSQQRISDTGRAVVAFPDEDPLQAKLNVTFDSAPAEVTANYWVLDTDYDNFAVVWGCFQATPNVRAENAWILSREPKLNDSVAHRVQELIEKYLDDGQLRRTIQDDDFCCSIETEVESHPMCGHHVMSRR